MEWTGVLVGAVPVTERGTWVDDDGELRLVSVTEAAAFLAIGRTALYALLSDGTIRSVQIGRARRIPQRELRRFVLEKLAAQDHAPMPAP